MNLPSRGRAPRRQHRGQPALPGIGEALFDRRGLASRLGEAETAVLLSWAQARLAGGEDAADVLAAVNRIDRIISQRRDLGDEDRLQVLLQLLTQNGGGASD